MERESSGRPFDTFEFARTHRHPPPNSGPIPPSLHWSVVLVLTFLTLGLFGVIWLFVQARFIQKVYPVGYGVFWLMAWLAFCLILIAARFEGHIGFAILFRLLASASYLGGLFSMKSSLEAYYNNKENMGLRLSSVMVYFFSVFYFQYHFHRIAFWRRTGIAS